MNLFGMPVYELPLIRPVPKIQLSPQFKYCTPEFRAELNQWFLDQFGTKEVCYVFGGALCLSPEQMRLLKKATASQPDDALSKLADDLEEASTVLDEQFHRDAICNVMLRAARALRQATPQPEAALPQYCRQLSNYPPTDMMPCDCGETCAVAARGGTANQQEADRGD